MTISAKRSLKILRTTFFIMLLAPVLNLLVIVIASLRDDIPFLRDVSERITWEALLLAGTLSALRRGHYPTLAEIQHTSVIELIISLVLCWLVASLVLSAVWFGLSYFVQRWTRQQRLLGCGIVLIALLLWVFLPTPAPPTSAHLRVDIGTSLGPLPQQQHAFSQGGEAEMRDPGYFEDAMQRMIPLHPQFIRIDHIYDYYHVYDLDAGGRPHYDWTELDRIVDAILAIKAKPFICISYMPLALARDGVYGPPKDWDAWNELVYQTVYHFNVERHLKIQYWEVWNEPNLPNFWSGTLDDYLRLYAATADGAHRADPTIHIGGPATASLVPEQAIGTLLYEKNWFDGLAAYVEQNHLPLDFVSWHFYDSRPANYAWSVTAHQDWANRWGLNTQLMITEWNRSSAPDSSLDTEAGAVHAAAVVSTLVDTSISEAFFFEPVDSSMGWEGRWGLMRADTLIKPVYNVFHLTDALAGERIPAQSDHTGVGVVASRVGATVNILIYHAGPTTVPTSLSIVGLTRNGIIAIKIYGVDSTYGNAFQASSDDLTIQNTVARVSSSGEWQGDFLLPPDSVRLVKITLEDLLTTVQGSKEGAIFSALSPQH